MYSVSDSVIKVAIVIDSLSKLLLWKPTSAVCSSLHQLYSSSSTNSQAGIVQLLCTSVQAGLLLAGSLVISFLIYMFDNNNIISYYFCSNKLLLKVFFFTNSCRSLISYHKANSYLEKFGSDLKS